MTSRTLAIVLVFCAGAFGQASFDFQSPACGYVFPAACWIGDPEGASFNGVLTWDAPAFGATIATANGLGMPVDGSQFLRVQCANTNIGTNIPSGGPIPETGAYARLWIPIPPGSTSVSFAWDFYTSDYVNAFYNDAVAVDVVSACGTGSGLVLANLVYADMHSPGLATVTDSTACGVANYLPAAGVRELAAPSGNTGPQFVIGAPLPGGAAFLRITAANGFDNAVTAQFVMDAVTFAGAGGNCATAFSSPLGSGSVLMVNTACPASAGRLFFTAVDLTAGTYPAGWFFGIDMTIPELLNEFNSGFPFAGVLDGSGSSSSGTVGPAPWLVGLTLFAVTTEWTPGYTALMSLRPKATYVIP